MLNLKSFENTLEYHELLMTLDNLNETNNYTLPENFKFTYWDNSKNIEDWVNIHISTGEFASYKLAFQTFYDFYTPIVNQLNKRVIFITDKNKNKIATTTISPTKEYGYDCVIDWFAIAKDFQGKHLAKPLLSKTIEMAKDLGYRNILLHTQTNSWLACKLYLDFGFTPLNRQDTKGWQILNTIINHPKLTDYKPLPEEKIFSPLILNIKKALDTLHSDYDFNVWYTNGKNDVYVSENGKYYEYKFFDNGNKLKFQNKY